LDPVERGVVVIRTRRTLPKAPASLATTAKRDAARLAKAAAANKLSPADFVQSVYGSKALRTALRAAQHLKCCYCEQKQRVGYSQVEHFRPKTRARRSERTEAIGYYWLAYELDNLYFSCANCNNAKRDWFPLVPNTRGLPFGFSRATHAESPMLLDPAHDDPEKELTFVQDPKTGRFRLAPKDGSARGAQTILRIALDNDDLDQLRDAHVKDHLAPVVAAHAAAKTDAERDAQRERARELAADDQEFALLARCYFRFHGLI